MCPPEQEVKEVIESKFREQSRGVMICLNIRYREQLTVSYMN